MFVLAMSLSIFIGHQLVPGLRPRSRASRCRPFADQQIGAAILWVCGDFWAVPALVVIIKRAVDQEGSLSGVLERLAHRGPTAPPDLRPQRAGTSTGPDRSRRRS